jgi:hypothetical protein
MATQTFIGKFKKDTSSTISVDEIRSRYFFGIPLVDPTTGELIDDDAISFYIKSSEQELERLLGIKLLKQAYQEKVDFAYNEWIEWGFIPTNYLVSIPVALTGFLNETLQVSYPEIFLSAKTSSDGKYERQINLVPISGSANSLSNNVAYAGIAPYVGYFGNSQIPNYWDVCYITGFEVVPADILNFIGKLTAINIFHILGDLVAGPGVATRSISIDNLSQSIGTTSSATNAGYGARILGYLKDLKKSEQVLRNNYKGFSLRSL